MQSLPLGRWQIGTSRAFSFCFLAVVSQPLAACARLYDPRNQNNGENSRTGLFLSFFMINMYTSQCYICPDMLCTLSQPRTIYFNAMAEVAHNLFTSSGDGGGRSGAGIFRSYFEPPGADGGLYGSGCFHFCSNLSVSVNNTCATCQRLSIRNPVCSYLLVPRIVYMSVCIV